MTRTQPTRKAETTKPENGCAAWSTLKPQGKPCRFKIHPQRRIPRTANLDESRRTYSRGFSGSYRAQSSRWFWWARWSGYPPASAFFHLLGALRGGRTQINVDQPTVVRQIQQLQRLETVSYTMDKIISGEHANAYLPKFLAGDRLLLVVHGEVIGASISRGYSPATSSSKEPKYRFTCPPPKVFSTASTTPEPKSIPATPACFLPRPRPRKPGSGRGRAPTPASRAARRHP